MASLRWLITGSFVLLIGMPMAGCSTDSVVGSRVDNFRAYYNTFYNAEQDFETGLESVQERTRALEPDRFVSVFPEPDGRVNRQAFEQAIDRAADILRDHPGSKWVDDALMLIGQSYFYLGEWGAAAEKFNEIIALSDDRTAEAQFWLARTRVSQGDAERAAEQVRTSIEQEHLQEPWASKLWLVQAELHTRQGAWREALQALDRALEGDIPRTEAARAQLMRAQLFEVRSDYRAATRAYRAAAESREFEVQLAGRMGALRTEAQTSSDFDLVRRADLLARDDRNVEQRDQLRLLEAYIQELQQRPNAALNAYQALLHGEEPVARALQGRAYYRMGMMYRNTWSDYETAAAYFDSSATALGQQEVETYQARPATALPNVRALAERYQRVAAPSARIARYDSLLTLGELPPQEFQERIDQIAEARRAEEAEQVTESRSEQQDTRFGVDGAEPSNRVGTDAPELTTEAASREAGFLFHRDPQRMQEGQRSFQRQWGDRDREPFWRIRDISPDVRSVEQPAIVDREAGAAEVVLSEAEEPEEDQATSAFDNTAADREALQRAQQAGLNVDEVPRTEEAQEEMRFERVWAWYELGNALFLNVSQPDSALFWYERVLNEAPNHPVNERAQYARAEALDAAGRTEEARNQYRALAEQESTSMFAVQSRMRLGEAPAAERSDSVRQAHQDYEEARTLGQNQEWESALHRLADLARTYPQDSDITPRVLWSVGQFYMEFHRRDSTAAEAQLEQLVETLGIPDAETESADREQRSMQQAGPPQQIVPSDESESPDDDGKPHRALQALMQHLSTTFPETAQARRAERLMRALQSEAEAPPARSERAPQPTGANAPEEGTRPNQGLPTPNTTPDSSDSSDES